MFFNKKVQKAPTDSQSQLNKIYEVNKGKEDKLNSMPQFFKRQESLFTKERRKSVITSGIAEGQSSYGYNSGYSKSDSQLPKESLAFNGADNTIIDGIQKTSPLPNPLVRGKLPQKMPRSEVKKISFLKNKGSTLGSRANTAKIYTSYSKLSEVKLLTIGIASPLRILQWAEKTLPNGKIYGEVLNANTLHHKTFKPQKGGLFCQRIFGPLKDFECACGKINKTAKQDLTKNLQSPKSSGEEHFSGISSAPLKASQQQKQMRKYCPECDVEYTWSVIRRYQLGYIKLSSPVTHVWFLKGTPSYLSLLLDMKKRHLQLVTYCSETLTLENSLSNSQKSLFIDSPAKIFATWEAIWKPKKETLTLPNQPNTPGKRFAIQPKQRKDWKKRMAERTDAQRELEVTHLTLNKEIKTKTANLSRSWESMAATNSSVSLTKLNLPSNISISNKLPVFLSTLQWSLYCNGTMSLNVLEKSSTESQKPYNEANVTKSKIQKIYKKLPIDYYIVCSLDRLLQKKLLRLSILNTWQTIYKDAYINAMIKVSKMFGFGVSTMTSGASSKDKKGRDGEKALMTNKKKFMNISKFYSLFYGIRYSPSFEGEDNGIGSNNYTHEIDSQDVNLTNKGSVGRKLQSLLQKVKSAYRKHVLMILKEMKQPIHLSKYTTSIDFSISDILMNSTMDMQKYLYMDTKHLSQLLSDSFLRPLLTAQFFANSSLVNPMVSGENGKAGGIAKGLSANSPKSTNSILSPNSLKDSLFTISDISASTTVQGLGQKPSKREVLKNILLFYKQQLKEFKSVSLLKKNFKSKETSEAVGSEDFLTKELYMNHYLQSKSVYQAIPLENTKYKKYNQLGSDSRTEMETFNRNETLSKKTKTGVYNNVYTLSHRERWESDKDWQVFLLYHSSSTEYNDIPIDAYKSRVFSFSEKNAFTMGNNSQNVFNAFTGKKTDWNESLTLSNAFFSGPGIIKQLLSELTYPELKKLDKQNRLLLYQLNQNILKIKKQVKIFVYDKSAQMELKDLCKKRDLLIRRTKLVRKLFRKDSDPSSMILTVLPVLPPDLRPIVKMGSQIAASDLNRLYQQVIYRNERLKFFLKDPATSNSYEMKYAQRLLQEAVDNLIQNSKSSTTSEKDSRGRSLKSLSDVLKGKQGRFRQFLLGKRVDYSGRSVIVVGPKLKLHECGLPVEMALELYLPFLLKRILNKKYAKTVIGAKSLIKNNTALAHELLREIMHVSPVLLNRAPTLHRLGIQAFVPKLVEGRAILLHPLVCSAFNADFDGDQMAVHVPITVEARAEAWKLMLSRNNILSPATGDPLAIPSQDMVLGCYYLTTYSKSLHKNRSPYQVLPLNIEASAENDSLTGYSLGNTTGVGDKDSFTIQSQQIYFNKLEDVIAAYNQQKLKIHTLVWVKWTGLIENGNDQEEPIEVRLSAFGQWQEISSNYQRFYDSQNVLVNQYMATTPGRILFNLIIQDSLQ